MLSKGSRGLTVVGVPRFARRNSRAHTKEYEWSRPSSHDWAVSELLASDAFNLLDDLMERWRKDPSSVHPSWSKYFENVEQGRPSVDALSRAMSVSLDEFLAGDLSGMAGNASTEPSTASQGAPSAVAAESSGKPAPESNEGAERRQIALIISMVKHFQKNGHLYAATDPLQLPKEPPFISLPRFQELKLSGATKNGPPSFETFGFKSSDWNKPVKVAIPNQSGLLGEFNLSERDRLSKYTGNFVATLPQNEPYPRERTIGELYERCKEVYTGPIGIEFYHVTDRARLNWIRNHFETPTKYEYSKNMKMRILSRTLRSCLFEQFAAQKFATMKRFGLDGNESLIVGMKAISKLASLLDVESIIIGMSHRGRLNVLANVMRKPTVEVFAEFEGQTAYGGAAWGNTGDVKYHQGCEYEYIDKDNGRRLLMSVVPNPSHLEAVNPVVLGLTRARQTAKNDIDGHRVLPILIHGDASISGQGILYECLQMSELGGYSVGGTIHIVVNNQIGFTANASEMGSGLYCTNLATSVNAPILHVNADDPEAVTYCMEVAIKYRQRFHKDIFIDLIGYRRFGHNELDMPKFTQPIMYDKIAKHPTLIDIYSAKLLKDGVCTQGDIDERKKRIIESFQKAYENAKFYDPKTGKYRQNPDDSAARKSAAEESVVKYAVYPKPRPYSPQWQELNRPDQNSAPQSTGVEREALVALGEEISTLPDGLNVHPTVKKVYLERLKALNSGSGIDFGLAEALAMGSLLREGYAVRLAGQDSERGTFSHRHAWIHDQITGKKYCPLKNYADRLGHSRTVHGKSSSVEIVNSPLSEYGCLGYEYGYSQETPNNLNIWEAQFGDFANGGQIIIDQFISSGEVKWNNSSGLVLILPHGYDGQGPEHSSGRIERYLELCDDREDLIHKIFWNKSKGNVILQQHNIQVCYPSTSSNYFHLIRRQMKRNFRKPLILFLSKKLLRFRPAGSDLASFTSGTQFEPYIPDASFKGAVDRKSVKRMILCTGQIYYDLVKSRAEKGLEKEIYIARVEQISPFPFSYILDDLQSLPDLHSVVWAQEEPMNQGPWPYVSRRLMAVLKHARTEASKTASEPVRTGKIPLTYVGRDVAASTACGDPKMHQAEQANIVKDAMDLSRTRNSYQEKYIENFDSASHK